MPDLTAGERVEALHPGKAAMATAKAERVREKRILDHQYHAAMRQWQDEYWNAHVFIAGQRRALTPTIKRELRRRSTIEPVIGHMKSDGRLGRNFLAGPIGDAINALLCGAGYNLRLILNYLAGLLRALLQALVSDQRLAQSLTIASKHVFRADWLASASATGPPLRGSSRAAGSPAAKFGSEPPL